MARPRTPMAKAALTGADKHDPQRYRARSEPKASKRELGKPPAYLPAMAKKAWSVFADEIPWLTYEDRGAVEIVSLMRAQIMAGLPPETPASFYSTYRMALSSLGATPVDRTKVYQPPQDDDDDPFGFLDAPTQ
ncbi:hypothetical protein PE067_09325 [Paracoccus sp. DMF-8]|uniref:hypothetical protein n=1 Tax=Paracoccus sp. DMF-8 TaxID=3019445 RepID=UPI0023E8E339|nr:hypothetical protein [Paracoccus sp. DMF-8]MDF3606319.1 hypothetical protein [Paracoccus sp. DMF-8]